MGAQFCSPGGDVVCGTKKDHSVNKLRLGKLPNSKRLHLFTGAFVCFPWELRKVEQIVQASAGGIQRHRRLGKAQPQERAAESRTETLL